MIARLTAKIWPKGNPMFFMRVNIHVVRPLLEFFDGANKFVIAAVQVRLSNVQLGKCHFHKPP